MSYIPQLNVGEEWLTVSQFNDPQEEHGSNGVYYRVYVRHDKKEWIINLSEHAFTKKSPSGYSFSDMPKRGPFKIRKMKRPGEMYPRWEFEPIAPTQS